MEILLLPFVLAFGAICFVLYVVALVNAAKSGKWVWFVLMLLFGPLALFYLLFAYERHHTMRRPVYRDRY